ncbi:MAG: phosphatase PAP2 family protein [Bdellovibrionaceae bacterium]|nr:phosphatase PAP2 family protein [Pseudobdellovibrionaceae bacterium]
MLKGLIFSFGLLATGLSMVFLDQDLALFFDDPRNHHWKWSAREITNIALGEYWFGLALLVFVFSRFFLPRFSRLRSYRERIKDMERWAGYFFLSLLGSGILLQLGKILVGRQRPHISEAMDHLSFHPLTLHWHWQSFPSGHSQVIFTVATCLTLLWPRMSWLFFLTATGLAFTRVMTLQHFLSDTIMGAMIGYFGSLWVWSLLRDKINRPVPFGHKVQTTKKEGL